MAILERMAFGAAEEAEGGGGGGGGGGGVVVNAGHWVLAGSQAAKPWQLVSLCVTDLIDHNLTTPTYPFLLSLSPLFARSSSHS